MKWGILGLGLLVAGCGSNLNDPVASVSPAAFQKQFPPLKQTFKEIEYRNYRKPGDATISGQAFLRQRGGGVVTCAGQKVIILPYTDYYKERVEHLVQGDPNAALDHNANEVGHMTICDAQGHFRFNNLPEGMFIVWATVRWDVGDEPQGGDLVKWMVLTAPELTDPVTLTDSDLVN